MVVLTSHVLRLVTIAQYMHSVTICHRFHFALSITCHCISSPTVSPSMIVMIELSGQWQLASLYCLHHINYLVLIEAYE